MHDLHHLDLVELVLADHAARVLAVAARLGAKARRVRGELDRQRLGGRISPRTELVSVISEVEIRYWRSSAAASSAATPPFLTANMSASNFGSCVVPTSASAFTMYGV